MDDKVIVGCSLDESLCLPIFKIYFQTEFGDVVSQLQLANESQKMLQKQVEQLQYERDILLEELETTGAINQSLR